MFDELGKQIANIMVTTMPSWQRYEEGKVEIHNIRGNLAGYTNYQCAPTCRRVPDPAERRSLGGANITGTP